MVRMPTQHCYWLLRTLALSLVVVHAVLTWEFFGGNFDALLEEVPLVEGQHSRLIYYGSQVAKTIREEGLTASTYDYHYQAGLTISPWNTSECRLAIIAHLLSPEFPLAAYKVLLLLMWLSLPWSLWIMCRVGNLGSGAISGAQLLFLGCAWSPWGVQLLRQGELDVIIGTASMGLALAQMVRMYARPRWWTLPGLFGTTATAIYFWPAILLLLLICFILFLGLLAGRLHWHRFAGLIFAFLAALAVNSLWIWDCWHTWWMLADRELILSNSMEEFFNIKANLQLMLWPGLLLVIGFLGTKTLQPGIGGRSALVWSFGIVLTTAAALLPQEIQTLHLDKVHGWWWCAVWLATIPVGKLIATMLEYLSKILGGYQQSLIVLTVLTVTAVFLFREELIQGFAQIDSLGRLKLKPSDELAQTVDRLKQHTTMDARILWEETRENAAWSPLVAGCAERALVGGLGRAESVLIEPLQVRMVNGMFLSKPIDQWSTTDLEAFSRDWNIGWIAAFNAASAQRWMSLPGSVIVSDLPQQGKLIRLARTVDYMREGQARISFEGSRRITFTQLQPVNGQMVISLHYHTPMRSLNSKAKLETWPQPFDGVPMLRIRMTEPMERLTIEW